MQRQNNQSPPLISVIIPVYNVQDYLKVCLDSVCGQTYKNIEIIVVDDGSTDESNKICRTYQGKDNRIRLIEKENGGLVSARKAGIREAKGRYIAFVDADDWIDADFVEKIVPYITGEDTADIVMFGCIEEYPNWRAKRLNTVKKGFYYGTEIHQLQNEMLMPDNFFEWGVLPHLCDKVMKKKLIERNIFSIPNTVSFGEDAACTFPCILEAERAVVLEITPYHYRQREGSMVKELRELGQEKFAGLYQVLKKAFGDNMHLKEQLKYYMFFVLLLKKYSAWTGNMPLFPFSKVQKKSRILVYGAGGFGRIIEQFVRNSQELRLAGWVDQNAAYYKETGLDVSPLNEIIEKQFDYLVIAILNECLAEKIQQELIQMGISPDKIDIVQKEVLKNQLLPDWLEDKRLFKMDR